MTANPVLTGCYHCGKFSHRIASCPLLEPPGDKDHHEARIATITRWFTEGQIGPAAKTRMIITENRLWADVRKVKK